MRRGELEIAENYIIIPSRLEEAVSAVAPLHPFFPTASPTATAAHPPPPTAEQEALDASTDTQRLPATNPSLSPFPPAVPVAPGRPSRRTSLLRRRGLQQHPSPFRTRAAGAHHRHQPPTVSAARLWNPTNSTPRTPTTPTTPTTRPRRPSTPPPPPVPLEVAVAPAGPANRSGFGDLPLLSPTSVSNRISLHLERNAGAEQRISLPPSVRHTPSPAEEIEAGPSIAKPATVQSSFIAGGRRLRSRGQSISSRLRVPFGLSLEPATRNHRDGKGKGKEKAPAIPMVPPEHDGGGGGGGDRFSPDLERGDDRINPRLSTASRISGIGSVISSSDSSIMGDPDQQPDNGEEWGPQHPCYPHLNPHVPLDSPEYTTTRIIRIRRDWLLEGDLAPTFSNLYPDILDPAGLSEQEFRRVIDKLNGELVPAFSPYNWRNVLDGVLGLATGWLWDDFGFTAVKSRLRSLENWIEQWNAEMARAMGAEEGSHVIPPKIIPLRRTGYMSLDIQIPDPEIAPASPTTPSASRDGPPQLAEPPAAITA